MATRGQGGIQQLLAAEQEAQHIVNAARNGKLTLYFWFFYFLFFNIHRHKSLVQIC